MYTLCLIETRPDECHEEILKNLDMLATELDVRRKEVGGIEGCWPSHIENCCSAHAIHLSDLQEVGFAPDPKSHFMWRNTPHPSARATDGWRYWWAVYSEWSSLEVCRNLGGISAKNFRTVLQLGWSGAVSRAGKTSGCQWKRAVKSQRSAASQFGISDS